MATKMGYAPGVRIQLKDNSAYTVVQNPNTVAGIVGYASKGELNKIINVANTGELGVKLGYGYQSYKYNQGMYAANAVLTTGGEVEFVRPYGEEISRTDAYKRDLKTDAFVVAFDKNAALYDDNQRPYASTSLNVKHFASTRYKTDGAAEFGVTRKINNIAETIESNNNVQFNVDASENFADSAASRKYDGSHCTDMVLFAIMNRDPSYANRAYDRYEVISSNKPSPLDSQYEAIECTLATKPLFSVGDEVYVPCTYFKVDQYGQKGTSQIDTKAEIVKIDDKVVTLKVPVSYGASVPNVLIYNDAENAVADGFDYLNIKTAVAGNSIKNVAAVKFGVPDKTPKEVIKTGTILEFRDKNQISFYVRLRANESPFTGIGLTSQSVDPQHKLVCWRFTGDFATDNYIINGDSLKLTWGSKQATFVVDTINADGTISGAWTSDYDVPSSVDTVEYDAWVEDAPIYVADVTAINEETAIQTGVNAGVIPNSWYYVTQMIADAIQSGKSYSRVAFTNDILFDTDSNKVKIEGQTIYVDPSAAYEYAIGDLVAIVHGNNAVANSSDALNSKALSLEQIYTITAINPMAGTITVDASKDIVVATGVHYQLLDLTSTNATVYNVQTKYPESTKVTLGSVYVNYQEAENKYVPFITDATVVANATVGSVITLKAGTGDEQQTLIFTVVSNDGTNVKAAPVDAVPSVQQYDSAVIDVKQYDFADMYFVSSYTLYVSKLDQVIATVGENTTTSKIATDIPFIQVDSCVYAKEVETSPTVLGDSDIGASFMALGLAKARYVDIEFDGNPTQVYTLTDNGIAVARMFMSIRYRFNGKLYEFEGTVAPFNYNNRQLSIKEAADYELEDSGLEFVLNDSGVLDYFLENNSYDLSQTIQNGVLNGSYTAIAYNEDDPAIKNDAVWTYDPQNNNSGSTLATVWNLFVNKDASDVDMLVAAGMAINAPFTKKYETLNTQVMQAMINVCEARKDCFCVFDGVYEPDIQKAVKKMISAGQLSLGRWGAIYDGRGVFQDSLYTNSQVDVMKSVQLAAIITANRSSGIFWIPPAGDEAYVPAAWGTKERFTRSYNSEDKNCDHAKLSDIHVNATRVNKDGIRIWGDFTCQMEDTAFNQIHVTMLVAGIHKMFYKYLDHKVFKLNTTVLRAQITSDLQDKLNAIKRQNPPGLIEGKVICDDTNNTPEIIDQNFLIVDLRLLPPKSTRWIILRTTVESQKNGKTIATEVIEQ